MGKFGSKSAVSMRGLVDAGMPVSAPMHGSIVGLLMSSCRSPVSVVAESGSSGGLKPAMEESEIIPSDFKDVSNDTASVSLAVTTYWKRSLASCCRAVMPSDSPLRCTSRRQSHVSALCIHHTHFSTAVAVRKMPACMQLE